MIRGYGMTTSEQATEHTCGACGGSGNPKPCECRVRRCYVPHDECDCGCSKGIAGGHACPVCLGAGRISDRMPAADAMVDAETLWRACISWFFFGDGGTVASDSVLNVVDARTLGTFACEHMCQRLDGTSRPQWLPMPLSALCLDLEARLPFPPMTA